MYRCVECEETFSKPLTAEYVEPCEYWGFKTMERMSVLVCPECGCEEFDELEEETEED